MFEFLYAEMEVYLFIDFYRTPKYFIACGI